MKNIKSLNETIIADLYVENLEEKIDMSRLSPIGMMLDKSSLFAVIGEDDCVDCGGKCDGFCALDCSGDCKGRCDDLCFWDKNPADEESETSNPWEDILNEVSNQNTTSQ